MIKINFFKKEKRFKKKDFTFHYNFYWRIIFICVTGIILSVFVFSYNLFRQINKESILLITNDGGQISLVNKDRINQVLNYFSERKNKSIEILNSPALVSDPS